MIISREPFDLKDRIIYLWSFISTRLAGITTTRRRFALAMVVVSSVLAIGAPVGESVGMLGVKLTGIFAGLFSLVSLIFFTFYNEKSVTRFIDEHRKEGKE